MKKITVLLFTLIASISNATQFRGEVYSDPLGSLKNKVRCPIQACVGDDHGVAFLNACKGKPTNMRGWLLVLYPVGVNCYCACDGGTEDEVYNH